MSGRPDVVVVGAGVIGLTAAYRLAERGHDVRVVARERPSETTSAVAAALWYPYRIEPVQRVTGWASRGLDVLTGLASEPSSGVVLRAGRELLPDRLPRPWFASMLPGFRVVTEVPAGYAEGWSFTAPVVEMPIHLRWLVTRLADLGVVPTYADQVLLPTDPDVVVNCTGLGSAALLGDATLVPVRGEVLVVSQVGLDTWLLDGSGLTYVVPRSRDIVVGGTDDEGVWDTSPDPAAAAAIMGRAVSLVPELAEADVLEHKVGLRPARPSVRLEAETMPDGRRVVHCYGHGGAGVTVAWGCADEVVALVEEEG